MKPSSGEISTETLRLDDENGIVGGSVSAICLHILSIPGSTVTELDEDTRIFCSTIGFWAPVEVVIVEMTKIASQRDVHARVEAIARFWCNNTPRLFWEEGSKDAILTLIEEGVSRLDSLRGRSLSNSIVEADKKFKGLLHPFAEMAPDSAQRVSYLWRVLRIDDIEASALSEQGLTGNVLLRIPADVLAEQLYIFHLKYLIAVDPSTDISLLLDRSASHRCRSPLVFSQSSPHFLTRLVYTHILGLDSSEAVTDVSMRAKYLTRWIEIGQLLKTKGDLAGFLAITTALLSMPLLRLKETWTDVDSELRTMVIRDWSPMMRELHRRELGQEGGNWTAHVLTPDLTQQDLDSHLVIPYYGDICTALDAFDIWAVFSSRNHVNSSSLRMSMSSFFKSRKRSIQLNMRFQDGSRSRNQLNVNEN